MDKENMRNYYSSVLLYKKLLSDGEITDEEYGEIESRLAEKYCIKNYRITRSNELIKSSFRAMYMVPNKGGKTNECK